MISRLSADIVDNVLRFGEGCLTESLKFVECLWQLLPNRCYVLGGLISTTQKEKEKCYTI